MTTTTTVNTLTKAVDATWLHGVTGQDLGTVSLPVGTLARSCESTRTEDGVSTRFQASEDGGETWYDYQTYAEPAGLFAVANPIVRHVEDEDGNTISILDNDEEAGKQQ